MDSYEIAETCNSAFRAGIVDITSFYGSSIFLVLLEIPKILELYKKL